MKILIIVATFEEIAPLLSKMNTLQDLFAEEDEEENEDIDKTDVDDINDELNDFEEEDFDDDDSVNEGPSTFLKGTYRSIEIFFHITGVGMVATSMGTTIMLMGEEVDLVLNLGVCGSFNKNLEIGAVVNVIEDRLSEMGVEDGHEFKSFEELGFENMVESDVVIKENLNEYNNYVIDLLPKVNGITVNTVHGNEASIEKVVKLFHPMVESMEGAAFMYVCHNFSVTYAQIRAVSNFVERRNRNNWNLHLAIENLNNKVIEILNAY